MMKKVYKLYNCTKNCYVNALSTYDAKMVEMLYVYWSLHGLRIYSEATDIIVKLGDRELRLINGTLVIPWEEINQTICVHQCDGEADVNFVNIEVRDVSDKQEWQKFIDSISMLLDVKAQVELYLMNLVEIEVDMRTQLYDGTSNVKLLDLVDKELETIAGYAKTDGIDMQMLMFYKTKFEWLRYDICVDIMRSDTCEEKVALRALTHIYNMCVSPIH